MVLDPTDLYKKMEVYSAETEDREKCERGFHT